MSRLFTPQTLGGHLKHLSLSLSREREKERDGSDYPWKCSSRISRLRGARFTVKQPPRARNDFNADVAFNCGGALRSESSSGQKDSFFFFCFEFFRAGGAKITTKGSRRCSFFPLCHPFSLPRSPLQRTWSSSSTPPLPKPATIESRFTSREQFKARIIIKSSWKGHLFHCSRGSTFVCVARQRSIFHSSPSDEITGGTKFSAVRQCWVKQNTSKLRNKKRDQLRGGVKIFSYDVG